MRYFSNAFSLSMLSHDALTDNVSVSVNRRYTLEDARDYLEHHIDCPDVAPFVSVVGHADTANMLSHMTGSIIPVNRVSVRLNKGDTMLVAQYIGTRLPEGAITLPEGAKIEWLLVTIN